MLDFFIFTYMKSILFLLQLVWCTTVHAQKHAGPILEEHPIYGPTSSLLGVMRRWNPSYFYPLDSSFHKYMNKYDRELLFDPARLDMYLKDRKFVWFRHSDTTFLPFKLN
jgi:hypothetical protein